MLKLPSVQNHYTMIFSGDPSLALTPRPDEGDLSEEANRQREQRDRELRVARETGDWISITKPGEVPSQFVMRPIPTTLRDWFFQRVRFGNLSETQTFVLAFRIACRAVVGLGEKKLKFEDVDGHSLVAQDYVDFVGSLAPEPTEVGCGETRIGKAILLELGVLVVKRMTEGLSPKS